MKTKITIFALIISTFCFGQLFVSTVVFKSKDSTKVTNKMCRKDTLQQLNEQVEKQNRMLKKMIEKLRAEKNENK